MLIDTHTHFYDEWLLPDADAAVERALAAGVGKMVQADVDSRERDALWAVNDRYPGVLYPMVGLYPCSVGPDWQEEIDKMLPYRERGVVAVGEIGLDYHEGDEDRELQKVALRVQLELASEWDLPVNIHLRDAWGDLFTVLEDCRHLHLRGILHCFSGSFEVYERARRCGDFSVASAASSPSRKPPSRRPSGAFPSSISSWKPTHPISPPSRTGASATKAPSCPLSPRRSPN